MSRKKTDFFVIPDAHAHPNYSMRRFGDMGECCAEFIATSKNEVVVVALGDWTDCSSITEHNSKLSYEGQRYKYDVQSALDSQADFFRRIKARKKKLPRFIMTMGNHEDRINRLVNEHPNLEGTIGVDDLGYKDFGWEVYPFQERCVVAGWTFIHGVPNRRGGLVSSENMGRNIAMKEGTSVVVGHHHGFDHHRIPYPNRPAIHGVNAGCITAKGFALGEGWSRPNAHVEWRGVIFIKNALDGDGDVQQWRAENFTNG